jgi:hypothetical protein
MSHLRLFRPTARDRVEAPARSADGPVILAFPATYARLRRGAVMNPLIRARVLYENRCCPGCRRPDVEPLELDDATLNRKQMPIPGTATLVGFHCHQCHREWPA